MAILPTVLHGLITAACFLQSVLTGLLASQVRRSGAAARKPEPEAKRKLEPTDRTMAAKCPPAGKA